MHEEGFSYIVENNNYYETNKEDVNKDIDRVLWDNEGGWERVNETSFYF